MRNRWSFGLLAGSIALISASPSAAITRDEVMVRAKAFAFHPWRATQNNLTASCSSTYQSVYTPGDYVGLPYDWGGYMSLFTFDQGIQAGLGAGSYPADGILSCTVGLDCSGYVSQCWNTTHLTTSTLHTQSSAISQAEILSGDALNQAGYHVILYSHSLANGDPILYEAIGYNVHINPWGGWAYASGYQPRRFEGITGPSAQDPIGTPHHPIPIPSLPFTDSRDTRQSSSNVFDGCGADPNKPESGPEFVYEVTITQPGLLTVSVSDDVGVDIDVHLYTSTNTNDCTHRDDSTFTAPVDCGTYLIVADTYGTGDANAGPYTLNVSFSATGASCGNGPPSYHPSGRPGDACGYPGQEHLPFCNANLGAEVCLVTNGTPKTSFCSHPCATATDCPEFPGGCCKTISSGESYCVTAPLCGGTPGDAGATDGPPSDTHDPDAVSDVLVSDSSNETDAILDSSVEESASDVVTQDSVTPAPDASSADASSDASSDAQIIDTVSTRPVESDEDSQGCACRMRSHPPSRAGIVLILLAGLMLMRRGNRLWTQNQWRAVGGSHNRSLR
ncbi:MAG TPA: hypothetical protein PKL24_06240 [Polyangiaceae bacterium]|nr:hypothetical protein [Polyangiaceae bacterium]HOD21613.1 hypothetical protein [Polyangiaceae bacterium]HOE50584.1 hypothetical protein [Polyangiaceae bacterium]HOG99718.1 hypothetical protein [Polyangiaceae bacterium]HOR34601.1 hypothetical protein [Polyangiaceae bacterium]